MTDNQILDAILRREGGYVDHPADHGGCTNYGITLGTLGDWRGHPVTCNDVKVLTEVEARQIYRERYLAPFAGCEAMVKPQLVDIAVHSGVTRARTLLALAQQEHPNRPLATALVIERLKFYARIVRSDPSQAVFLGGWIARACEFL